MLVFSLLFFDFQFCFVHFGVYNLFVAAEHARRDFPPKKCWQTRAIQTLRIVNKPFFCHLPHLCERFVLDKPMCGAIAQQRNTNSSSLVLCVLWPCCHALHRDLLLLHTCMPEIAIGLVCRMDCEARHVLRIEICPDGLRILPENCV